MNLIVWLRKKMYEKFRNNINDMVSKCRKSIEQEINREPEYDAKPNIY